MAVIRSSEISLNSKYYKINGLVRPSLVSVFPQKMVVGDFTKDDEVVASTWIISDQRGGMLIEEMEPDIHRDRFYWSTCNTDYKGHIILPPLATEVLCPSLATSPTSSDDPDTEWTDDAKTYNDDISDKGYDDVTANDWGSYLELIHAGVSNTIGVALYLSKESADITKVDVDAYYGSAWHDLYEDTFTDGAWLTVNLASAQTVTKFRVRFYNNTGSTKKGYIHDTKFLSAATVSYLTWANYNSELYLGANKVLSKLNSVGDNFDYVYDFDNNILDLTPSLGVLFISIGAATGDTRLAEDISATVTGFDVDDASDFTAGDYIRTDNEVMLIDSIASNTLTVDDLAGDRKPYWGTTAVTHLTNARVLELRQSYYMDTEETFTACNAGNARLGVDWDDKFFLLDKLNQISYLTTPGGDLAGSGRIKNLPDSAVKSLLIYRDANANPIIYAGTKVGLFAHDYTNSKWVRTELKLPEHPTCGAGVAWWRDACYLSAGLNVYEYIAGTIAYIASMGLDSEDGLPTKYVGEIAKFTEGYDNFFALVDASLTSGTGYSSVFVYNGGAWRCRWVDTTADQVMNNAVISSEYAYRYWWAIANKIYYIPLERSLRNPLKISTYTYGAAGVHITGVFDAGAAWDKRAIRLKALCDKMDAGNEEIVVKYRINEKCYEGIDAANTWTTLVTLDTDGETSTDFASSVGLLYKQIQFRFDLSRGSTTTKTPDLQRVTLVYERTIPAAWGWDIEIDLTKEYRGQSPEQMWQNLKAIITAGLLVPFVFTHEDGSVETNYVEIRTLSGTATTGEEKLGTYSVRLVAP